MSKDKKEKLDYFLEGIESGEDMKEASYGIEDPEVTKKDNDISIQNTQQHGKHIEVTGVGKKNRSIKHGAIFRVVDGKIGVETYASGGEVLFTTDDWKKINKMIQKDLMDKDLAKTGSKSKKDNRGFGPGDRPEIDRALGL